MKTWFKVSANGQEAYMLVVDGEFIGYFGLDGLPLEVTDGTVYVTENNVAGPL